MPAESAVATKKSARDKAMTPREIWMEMDRLNEIRRKAREAAETGIVEQPRVMDVEVDEREVLAEAELVEARPVHARDAEKWNGPLVAVEIRGDAALGELAWMTGDGGQHKAWVSITPWGKRFWFRLPYNNPLPSGSSAIWADGDSTISRRVVPMMTFGAHKFEAGHGPSDIHEPATCPSRILLSPSLELPQSQA